MITETVQLDPLPQPGLGRRAQVEAELRPHLGVDARCVWLPRGLTKDYERVRHPRVTSTSLPRSCVPGVVRRARAARSVTPRLRGVPREPRASCGRRTDARGPPAGGRRDAWPRRVTHADDGIVDWSYINHYVCNGAVILCAFDDPRDEEAGGDPRPPVPGPRGRAGRRPADLRRWRRHPLHHPAAARRVKPSTSARKSALGVPDTAPKRLHGHENCFGSSSNRAQAAGQGRVAGAGAGAGAGQWVWTMSTLHGARLATSPAIEPSTRAAP